MNNKVCNRCMIKKDATEFHKQRRNKDGLQSICKECRKCLDIQIYRRSPKKRASITNYRRETIELMRKMKEDVGCKYCGEREPVCLDLHHPNKNKEMSVANAANFGISKMLKEFAKCDVVCSNCHRKIHGGIVL